MSTTSDIKHPQKKLILPRMLRKKTKKIIQIHNSIFSLIKKRAYISRPSNKICILYMFLKETKSLLSDFSQTKRREKMIDNEE